MDLRTPGHAKVLFIAILLTLPCTAARGAGLIVNELSNGTSGNREFFELLVVGDAAQPLTPIDLNGWIIDDQNGDWSGAGIAPGFMRFNSTAPGCTGLQSVAPGAIVLVYNNDSTAIPSTTKNTAITAADDLNDTSPADSVYIIPNTSACIDGYNAPPYSGAPGATSWSRIALRNGGDAGQVRSPAAALFHGISFGDVGDTSVPSNGVDIADGNSSGTGRNYFLGCGDWFDTTSYGFSNAVTGDSPGRTNDARNRILIERITAGQFDYTDPANPQNCIALPAAQTPIPTMHPFAYVLLAFFTGLIGLRHTRQRN